MGEYGLSFFDYSDETANMRIRTGPVNDLTYILVTTQALALKTAVQAVIVGTLSAERLVAYDNTLSRARPASTQAQRENKWLVVSEGSVSHRLFRHEIATADLTLLTTAGSDSVTFTAGVFLALATAFNAILVDNDGTSATTVRRIQFVGRNL